MDESIKVIQIIPADPRWKAIYKSKEKDAAVSSTTLACWALIEDKHGFRHVMGMDCENEKFVDFCVDYPEFVHYEFHPDE